MLILDVNFDTGGINRLDENLWFKRTDLKRISYIKKKRFRHYFDANMLPLKYLICGFETTDWKRICFLKNQFEENMLYKKKMFWR